MCGLWKIVQRFFLKNDFNCKCISEWMNVLTFLMFDSVASQFLKLKEDLTIINNLMYLNIKLFKEEKKLHCISKFTFWIDYWGIDCLWISGNKVEFWKIFKDECFKIKMEISVLPLVTLRNSTLFQSFPRTLHNDLYLLSKRITDAQCLLSTYSVPSTVLIALL